MVKIAYCAGHGFNTAGKRTPDGEREWSFNNKLALAFAKEMAKYDNVSLKRMDDPTGKTDVPLTTRTNGANSWGANIYISFHHNALASKWGTHTGVETHVYLTKPSSSVKLAGLVQAELVKAYGLKDRGIKYTDLHITRETRHYTSILVEGGFMDSTIDIKKLRDDKVLTNAGIGVAKAVAKFAGLKLKATSTTSTTKYKKPTQAKGTYPTGSIGKATIVTDVLNVRSTYSTNGKVIGAVNKGETYFVYKEAKGWYLIANGEWISGGSGKYAKFEAKPKEVTYRIRKTWADEKSQIGAYTNLDSAKKLADSKAKDGYKVFDESGKVIYTPKVEKPVVTPKPKPKPEPKPVDEHKGHTDIKGKPVISADKMVAFVKAKNPNAKYIDEIANQFVEVGKKYNIRGDIAFCQSIIETGWFKFDGGTVVTPEQHNYCGLGVVGKGVKGNEFVTVKDGVTAQIQHLYAYACKDAIPKNEFIVDPRFTFVTRGVAPHWEDLSMKWAMNEKYGTNILNLYKQLVDFKYDVKKEEQKDKENTTIEKAPVKTPSYSNEEDKLSTWKKIVDYFIEKLKK